MNGSHLQWANARRTFVSDFWFAAVQSSFVAHGYCWYIIEVLEAKRSWPKNTLFLSLSSVSWVFVCADEITLSNIRIMPFASVYLLCSIENLLYIIISRNQAVSFVVLFGGWAVPHPLNSFHFWQCCFWKLFSAWSKVSCFVVNWPLIFEVITSFTRFMPQLSF